MPVAAAFSGYKFCGLIMHCIQNYSFLWTSGQSTPPDNHKWYFARKMAVFLHLILSMPFTFWFDLQHTSWGKQTFFSTEAFFNASHSWTTSQTGCPITSYMITQGSHSLPSFLHTFEISLPNYDSFFQASIISLKTTDISMLSCHIAWREELEAQSS